MEYLRRAHEIDPGDAETARLVAGHLITFGHLTPAREVIERWLETDPDNAEARALLEELARKEETGETAPPKGPSAGALPRLGGDRPPPPDCAHQARPTDDFVPGVLSWWRTSGPGAAQCVHDSAAAAGQA